MIVYKAIKDGIGHFINAGSVREYHANGYKIVKDKEQEITEIQPTEEIPDGFFEEG